MGYVSERQTSTLTHLSFDSDLYSFIKIRSAILYRPTKVVLEVYSVLEEKMIKPCLASCLWGRERAGRSNEDSTVVAHRCGRKQMDRTGKCGHRPCVNWT